MNTRKKVFLVSYSRTPVGRHRGVLSPLSATDLLKHVMKNALSKASISPEQLELVITSQGFQDSTSLNIARWAALQLDWPRSIIGYTVQQQCSGGMTAITLAMDKIWLGKHKLVLASGVESMSNVPYFLDGSKRWSGIMADLLPQIVGLGPFPFIGLAENGLAPNALIRDINSIYMLGAGQCLVDFGKVSRQRADQFALESQIRAWRANYLKDPRLDRSRFALEIDPILVPGKGLIYNDEHVRGSLEQNPQGGTTLEQLARLKGQFGTASITAGNASGINDGAFACLVADEDTVKELGLTPIAEFVDYAQAAVDPSLMGIGPVPAIVKLKEQTGWTNADVDGWEINEAFAGQVEACADQLEIPRDRLNVNGGAVAIGHPIANSGGRISCSLAIEMVLRGWRRGIAALCVGGGHGTALAIKALQTEDASRHSLNSFRIKVAE